MAKTGRWYWKYSRPVSHGFYIFWLTFWALLRTVKFLDYVNVRARRCSRKLGWCDADSQCQYATDWMIPALTSNSSPICRYVYHVPTHVQPTLHFHVLFLENTNYINSPKYFLKSELLFFSRPVRYRRFMQIHQETTYKIPNPSCSSLHRRCNNDHPLSTKTQIQVTPFQL